MSDVQRALDGLWAGVVMSHRTDIANHMVEVDVKVTDGGAVSLHTLRLSEVRAVEYARYEHDPSDNPWKYVELTSVEARLEDRNGQWLWRVDAELWEDRLTIWCERVEVESDGFSARDE